MLLTEHQMSDHKGARLILNALPPARVLIADRYNYICQSEKAQRRTCQKPDVSSVRFGSNLPVHGIEPRAGSRPIDRQCSPSIGHAPLAISRPQMD